MIKILGLILVSGAVSAYGAYLSSQIRTANILRTEISDFLKHLYNGVKYTATSRERLFSGFSAKNLEKCGFLNILRLKNFSKQDFDESLYLLTAEEKNRLYDFFTNFGRSGFCDKEALFCLEYREYFDDRIKSLKNQDDIRSVLYKKLGIIAALLTAIIFI